MINRLHYNGKQYFNILIGYQFYIANQNSHTTFNQKFQKCLFIKFLIQILYHSMSHVLLVQSSTNPDTVIRFKINIHMNYKTFSKCFLTQMFLFYQP